MIKATVMDTKDGYCVRFYEPGEEHEIVAFLSLIFNEWKVRGDKALDHWKWMYQDNPIGPSNIAVALKDDKIVGTAHNLNVYTKVGNTIEKSSYGTDFAVHPDHRRNGLYDRMLEFLKANRQDFGFQYSYTTNKILIDWNNKRLRGGTGIYFVFPFDVNRYLLIHDIDLHMKKKKTDHPWIQKQGYSIKKMISSVKKSRTDSGGGIKNLKFSETRCFDGADDFWENIKSKYTFIALKNRENLEWRFSDPRAGDYHTISAKIGDELAGYIVVSIDYETPDYPMGNIIDCLTTGDLFVQRMLIEQAVSWLKDRGINAVSAYAIQGSKYGDVLESFGFLDRGDTLYIMYYIPDKIGVRVSEFDKAGVDDIHIGYSDFYVK